MGGVPRTIEQFKEGKYFNFKFIEKTNTTEESVNQNNSNETSTHKPIYKLEIAVVNYDKKVRFFYRTYDTYDELEEVMEFMIKDHSYADKEEDAISLMKQYNFIENSEKGSDIYASVTITINKKK